ncbi:MAG TPA: hypothetical protein VMT21_07465 [Gemmatimonadales bacterium]|nr:hypothetical protein [Gemmatimonadales bacterium]
MSTAARLRGALRRTGIASAVLLVAACTDLSGPHRTVRPEMGSLRIAYFSATSGIMQIVASPADTSFRLGSGQSVPIEITTSSGDREASALYPQYCPVPMRGWRYTCFEFDFGTRSDVSWQSVNGYVAGIGGRIKTWLSNLHIGFVVLFDLDDQVSRARSALSWPGVTYVELSPPPFCADDVGNCIDWSTLTRPVYVEAGTPHPGDGTLQVQSGDTVTVVYRQPGGGTMQAQSIVP